MILTKTGQWTCCIGSDMYAIRIPDSGIWLCVTISSLPKNTNSDADVCTLVIPLTTWVLFWWYKRFLGQAWWWFSYVPFYEVPSWYFVSNCNTLCMILDLVCRKKRLIKVVSSSISTNLNTYMNSTYVLYINKITFQSSYLST